MKTTERVFEQEIEWALIHENGYVKGNGYRRRAGIY